MYLSEPRVNVFIDAFLQSMLKNTTHHLLSKAYDIMVNTSGYNGSITILSHVSYTCERLGLTISTEKIRILNRLLPNGKGVTGNIQLNDGLHIEYGRRLCHLVLEVPLYGAFVTRLIGLCIIKMM